MRREKINRELRQWFALMVERYTWLSIRYEYNTRHGCYMVSYYPEDTAGDDADFALDAMEFEDMMNEKYPDDAPLFCDGESLFKLSPDAETFSSSRRRQQTAHPSIRNWQHA